MGFRSGNCNDNQDCYQQLTTGQIAPLTYIYGLDANGCWKFQLLPTSIIPPTYLGCDGLPINPLTDRLVECSQFPALWATELFGLTVGTPAVYGTTQVLGSDGFFHLLPIVTAPTDIHISSVSLLADVLTITETDGGTFPVNLLPLLASLDTCGGIPFNPLTDQVVTCAQFPNLFTTALLGRPLTTPAVYGTTQVLGSDGNFHLLPTVPSGATTNVLGLVGNVLSSTVNGVVASQDLSTLSVNGIALTVIDSPTINFTASGIANHTLTGDVRVSASVGNAITVNPDGLFVAVSAFAGVNVNAPLTGNGAGVPLDINFSLLSLSDLNALGNVIPVGGVALQVVGVDGTGSPIRVPFPTFAETPNAVVDTNSINLTASGAFNRTIQADVRISATAGNIITINPDGIFAASGAFAGVNVNSPITGNGAGIPLDINFAVLTALDYLNLANGVPVGVSPVSYLAFDLAGNPIKVTAPTFIETPITVVDSPSIDFTASGIANHTLTGVVRISATLGNSLTVNPDGLYVAASGFTGINASSPLTGLGTSGSPLDIDFGSMTPTDLCDLFGNIGIGTTVNIVGTDAGGCPTVSPIDCTCAVVAPISNKAIGCLPAGGIGTVSMFERSSAVSFTF